MLKRGERKVVGGFKHLVMAQHLQSIKKKWDISLLSLV